MALTTELNDAPYPRLLDKAISKGLVIKTNTRLLQTLVNYGGKKFYSIETRTNHCRMLMQAVTL
jgi:hypothetical protein